MVYWDTSPPAFLSGTVPCNATYLPTYQFDLSKQYFKPDDYHTGEPTRSIARLSVKLVVLF
jgi:hypothetical protein